METQKKKCMSLKYYKTTQEKEYTSFIQNQNENEEQQWN